MASEALVASKWPTRPNVRSDLNPVASIVHVLILLWPVNAFLRWVTRTNGANHDSLTCVALLASKKCIPGPFAQNQITSYHVSGVCSTSCCGIPSSSSLPSIPLVPNSCNPTRLRAIFSPFFRDDSAKRMERDHAYILPPQIFENFGFPSSCTTQITSRL